VLTHKPFGWDAWSSPLAGNDGFRAGVSSFPEARSISLRNEYAQIIHRLLRNRCDPHFHVVHPRVNVLFARAYAGLK
jgi:hypothetical protein